MKTMPFSQKHHSALPKLNKKWKQRTETSENYFGKVIIT